MSSYRNLIRNKLDKLEINNLDKMLTLKVMKTLRSMRTMMERNKMQMDMWESTRVLAGPDLGEQICG